MTPTRPAQDNTLLLQRFIVDRPAETRGLYWYSFPASPATPGGPIEIAGRTLLVPPDTTLSFETYFNGFFESLWRRHTRLGTLVLRVHVQGPCTLRVLRRALGGPRLVHEQAVPTGGAVDISLPDHALTFRQHGLLALEVVTGKAPATFMEAAWLALQPELSPVGLAPVFCTFNREADIARVLASIAGDPVLSERLSRVFVISQGRPGLARTPGAAAAAGRLGERLRIIEQDNFGGAGGFGRGLLAAVDDPGTTHAVLLDDDIVLEPDSLLRMASFFALARAPIVVGGHMLDSVHPMTLYEAGAVMSDRHWAFQPQHHSRDLRDHGVLEALTHPHPVHYNGWWCCGIPLCLVAEHGMPLPCFIRGDDLEFGLRLHQAGVTTVAVPGIAVWHEPFYLKNGSWHAYYETRNVLIAASLHQPIGRWEVVRRMGRHLAMSLLTFRYYNAALILQGLRDYLAGPAILQQPPQPVHAGLAALRRRYPAATTRRGLVLAPQPRARPPRSTLGYLVTLGRLIVSNAMKPTPRGGPRLLPGHDFAWPQMRGIDHVAVETWWDDDLPTFHRSREHFRALAIESVRLLLALYRGVPGQAATWQAALPLLASLGFWRRYLDVPEPTVRNVGVPEAEPAARPEPVSTTA